MSVSNYLSPEALTVWLTEKQNEVYGDMRDAIDMSNQRSEMQSDLADIRQHLQDSNKSQNFDAVNAEIGAFLEKYAGNPAFEEVAEPLKGIQTTIEATKAAAAGAQALNLANLEALGLGYQSVAGPPPRLAFDTALVASWCETLEAKGNYLSQQDQLAMITIQELNGQVNQSEQLVSNLIASKNQTEGSIIANIRG